MKNIVIVSILISLVVLGIIFSYVGNIIGDDMVNILSMLAAIIILGITVGVGLKYVNQMKNDKASGQLADENWDGIGEFKNELPTGWAVSFLTTIVWTIWYWFFGYPLWAYSQIGEYNEEVKAYNKKFEEKHANISDDELNNMGESVFLINCAPCHGVSADGIDSKAANLTKRLDSISVKHVIMNGSNNGLVGEGIAMPDRNGLININTGNPISDAEISLVADYVTNGFVGSQGAEVFADVCSACHGTDGTGMPMVAPNIKNFTVDLITAVLQHGKTGAIGKMPSFKTEDMRLTATQQKAVATYIIKLQEGSK
jgi:cytochrome c oxidase cbb3-type subunit 3